MTRSYSSTSQAPMSSRIASTWAGPADGARASAHALHRRVPLRIVAPEDLHALIQVAGPAVVARHDERESRADDLAHDATTQARDDLRPLGPQQMLPPRAERLPDVPVGPPGQGQRWPVP